MSPRKMDADNLLSGRRVYEGEVIGEVGNYSMRENGTSYHLHFDIQVPTRHGWVLVNPYMTLVAAYERLIDERGTELADPSIVATADPGATGSTGGPRRRARKRRGARSRNGPRMAAARRNGAATSAINAGSLNRDSCAGLQRRRALLEWRDESHPPSCFAGRVCRRGALRARCAG